MAIDSDKLGELLGRFVDDLGAVAHSANAVIGDKLGLYKGLAALGPSTPAALAARTATGERYVAEWLAGQAAGGYVSYDPATGTFHMTEEQVAAFADETSPAYVLGAFRLATACVKDEPRVTEAFRGGGFAWGDHHDDLFTGTERFFRPGYSANLVSAWLPALDGVVAKLEAGAAVADIGCGLGTSTILMARSFPRSSFHGSDNHAGSVELARTAVADAGLADRVTIEAATAQDFPGTGYDLVTSFDCLHDMGDPVGAARHVRSALAPDGTWLLVEPFAGDHVEDNLNPVGRVFYGFGSLICVPHSLSEPVGLALGPQAGERRVREVVTEAGFTRFRRATETPFNLVFEARP
jgi:SAM-dependent methyltransferase